MSGLGLEAQREAVVAYAASRSATIVREFVEVESGKATNRPVLADAITSCNQLHATLAIAKLDRLARSVHFISGLMEGRVPFVAVDMPFATPLLLHVMSAFAEHEREMISQRTSAALAAAKARGVRLGANGSVLAAEHRRRAQEFAETIRPHVYAAMRDGAMTHAQIAAALNDRRVPTREPGRWHATSVARVLGRLADQAVVDRRQADPALTGGRNAWMSEK